MAVASPKPAALRCALAVKLAAIALAATRSAARTSDGNAATLGAQLAVALHGPRPRVSTASVALACVAPAATLGSSPSPSHVERS